MKFHSLYTAILETVIWFEIIGRPLKEKELYANLWRYDGEYSVFEKALYGLIKKKKLSIKDGYVIRKEEALKRYLHTIVVRKNSDQLVRKIQKILQWIPCVDAVYLVNSTAFESHNKSSDIDLLVVAQRRHLWAICALYNILFLLLNLRVKQGQKRQSKICLSFFLASEDINIHHVQITQDDRYLPYWILWAQPLLIKKSKNILLSGNHWIRDYLPMSHLFLRKTGAEFPMIIAFISWFLDNTYIMQIFSSFVHVYLQPWTRKKYIIHQDHGTIEISERMIKLHKNDQRQQFIDSFEKIKKEIE